MNTIKSSPDDRLHFEADQHLQECFEKDEYILMSCSLSKYNKRQKCQERAMLITSKAIYNINKFELLSNIISFFKNSYSLRRRINIEKLAAITVSEVSSEFVIHVKDEYDYRYSSPQRDKIITMILRAYEMNVKQPLTFFYRQNVNLHEFTTTGDDMKAGVTRMPTENPILMDRGIFLHSVGVQVTLDDFEILKEIGRGDYGKTFAVEKKDTKQIYIIKSIEKELIIDRDQIEHTKFERYLLEKSQSPWILQLEFAFQTPEKLFLGTKPRSGGELFGCLRKMRRFNEEVAKFYASEIILGLEYLHKMGVIYRDLKPENILVDEEGHICLRGFKMSKRLDLGQRTRSFVGTPEYLSPEVITGEGYGHSMDWWALGATVYEMLFGRPPFYQRDYNVQKMFEEIRKKDVTFFSKVSVGEDAKDFLLQLLQKDPEKRLGSKDGADEVKRHKWLADINWDVLAKKRIVPPFKPKLIDYREPDYDCGCGYRDFHVPKETNMELVNKYQDEFKAWKYNLQKDSFDQK